MAIPTWNRRRQWSRMTLVSFAALRRADVANVDHARLGYATNPNIAGGVRLCTSPDTRGANSFGTARRHFCRRHSDRAPGKLSSVEMSGMGYLGRLLEVARCILNLSPCRTRGLVFTQFGTALRAQTVQTHVTGVTIRPAILLAYRVPELPRLRFREEELHPTLARRFPRPSAQRCSNTPHPNCPASHREAWYQLGASQIPRRDPCTGPNL